MGRLPRALVLCSVLAGCATGPDYQRPPVDAPAQFRFNDAQARDMANAAWWEQFQDPALNDMIAVALRENKDIQIAAARIEQFLGLYGSTRSLYFPQVSANVGGSRRRDPGAVTGGVAATTEQYEAALSLSWELDLFGRLRRQTEAARARVLASEEGRRATILTLVSSVAASYISLRELERQLAIARNTVESRAVSLKLFTDRFEGGTVSELELSQSRAEYEASLVEVPRLEAQIGQQENALSVLLGRNPGPIGAGRELAQLGLPAVPAGLPSELLERRPDLRQAEQELVAANAEIGAARAQYFPSIVLTGLFGWISPEFSMLFDGPAKAWSYGLSAAAPIFTGGGIAGQVTRAEGAQREALLRYQQSIQVAFREVSDALVAHAKAREQLAFQERQVATLAKYLELANLRYDEGYTSYIEVLDAQRNLFNAQVAHSQTLGTVYVSLVNIYKAMGGGWVAQAERMAVNTAAPH